jgi:hypothetical protein
MRLNKTKITQVQRQSQKIKNSSLILEMQKFSSFRVEPLKVKSWSRMRWLIQWKKKRGFDDRRQTHSLVQSACEFRNGRWADFDWKRGIGHFWNEWWIYLMSKFKSKFFHHWKLGVGLFEEDWMKKKWHLHCVSRSAFLFDSFVWWTQLSHFFLCWLI